MVEWLHRLLEQALEIWRAGGWAMIALAANAFVLFVIGMNLWINMASRRRLRSVPESEWRRWIADPSLRRRSLGELISFLMSAGTLHDLRVRFGELQATELSQIERDLRFMRRAVSTAPLLGLLGTVTGMLTTFQGLAGSVGGDQTLDIVAGGISEALITTETGLIIALPGLFFQYYLSRERDRYGAFLAHLETVCSQAMVTYTEIRRRTKAA